MSTSANAIGKDLIFACKMYKLFPNNRDKYRGIAQLCVAKLEAFASNDSDVFTAWQIGQVALDQMRS